jgi:hypothetical protein
VSYNKWTSVADRTATALPENLWTAAPTTWCDGTTVTEQRAESGWCFFSTSRARSN